MYIYIYIYVYVSTRVQRPQRDHEFVLGNASKSSQRMCVYTAEEDVSKRIGANAKLIISQEIKDYTNTPNRLKHRTLSQIELLKTGRMPNSRRIGKCAGSTRADAYLGRVGFLSTCDRLYLRGSNHEIT